MSAIVAAVGDPSSAAWVDQATAYSRRAGPDGAAVHHEPSCGLGHAWLQTSPTHATQPIALDRQTWLTADVRLDDRRTLVATMRGAGRTVTIDTPDAELVLHAYAIWGTRCVEHLSGDFAFALWDGARKQLFCARDQLGVAPLHYAHVHGGLLVATSIDALRMHPDVSDELDEAAIADFLLCGHSSDFTSTAYAHIRRVPPAHTLTWTRDGLRTSRYWQLQRWAPLVRHETQGEYIDEFRATLDDAVADRVTADRLSVQLSGGMDSTSVAASAAVALARRGAPAGSLGAITAVLGDEGTYREQEVTALVAAALDIRLEVVDASQFPPLDPWAEPLVVTPEPAPYMRTSFDYNLAALAAAQSTVALGGHGGDALLWSSRWYWASWLAHGRALRLGNAFIDHRRLFGTRLHPALRAGLLGYLGRHRHPPEPLPGWLDDDFARAVDAADRRVPGYIGAERLDVRSLAGEPLWSSLATSGHPSFTGLPVRFRYPFMDLRLINLALALPPEPWLQGKRILRDAAHSRLPEEIRRRPKSVIGNAPSIGRGPVADARLADFVRDVADLSRFIDVDALVAELAAAPSWTADVVLARPLGLAHWLVHRRQNTPTSDARPPIAV